MIPEVLQVQVPTPGTPVQVSASHVKCARLQFVNRTSHTAAVGVASMSTATGVGVIGDLPAASGAVDGTLLIDSNSMFENPYDLFDYFVDAGQANDKINVCYWVA